MVGKGFIASSSSGGKRTSGWIEWPEKAPLFLIRLFIDFLSHNFKPHICLTPFPLAVSNPLSLPSIDQCFNLFCYLQEMLLFICFLPRNEYCTENWCSSLLLPWSWCTAEKCQCFIEHLQNIVWTFLTYIEYINIQICDGCIYLACLIYTTCI